MAQGNLEEAISHFNRLRAAGVSRSLRRSVKLELHAAIERSAGKDDLERLLEAGAPPHGR